MRDFSISDETVPEDIRGTYKAFTQSGSDGMTHLRRLADAGIGLEDVGLRRPTLDEVFLTLTGHPSEETEATPA